MDYIYCFGLQYSYILALLLTLFSKRNIKSILKTNAIITYTNEFIPKLGELIIGF